MDPDELENSGADAGLAEAENEDAAFEQELELDEEGNPIEPEPEPEPTVEPEPAVRTAPRFNFSGMTAEQRQEINLLLLGEDPVSAFERYSEIREQQQDQRRGATEYQTGSLAEQAPEFMKRYGTHVRAAVAEVNRVAQKEGRPAPEDAPFMGVANAVLQEMLASKDIGGTLRSMADAYDGKAAPAAAAPRPKAPKPALRAGQRVPTPTTSVSPARPGPQQQARSGDPKVQALMALGLSKEDAQRARNSM